MNIEVEHKYVTVNNINLHYVTAGSPEGQTVLLIHGFPDFWYSWRQQIPALVQAGYNIIAPDLKGYNKSDKPTGLKQYSMSILVGEYIELLKTLGKEQVIVVGHDWGGAVAWNLAMYAPEAIEKLVVLNSPHPIPFLQKFWSIDLKQLQKSWYVLLFQLPDIPEKILPQDNFKFLRTMLHLSAINKNTFTDKDIEKYVEAWSQPDTIPAMLAYYRANWNIGQLLAMSKEQQQEMLNRFPKISVQTLVIWGEKDGALDKSLNDGLDQLVSGSFKLKLFANAGHWVHLDLPDQVNELLLSFLNE